MTREADETETNHDWVRVLLASTPLPDPGPERISRWRTAVDDAVHEATHEAVGAARVDAVVHHRLRPTPDVPRDRRPYRFGGVSLAAAAVVVALALPAGSAVDGGAAGPDGWPLMLSRAELPALAARAFSGGLDRGLDRAGSGSGPGHDSGPLADPVARAECLTALGVTEPPLGGRAVVLDGRSGVLLALPTGRAGRLRLLVVAPSCGAGGPTEVLADQVVGP